MRTGQGDEGIGGQVQQSLERDRPSRCAAPHEAIEHGQSGQIIEDEKETGMGIFGPVQVAGEGQQLCPVEVHTRREPSTPGDRFAPIGARDVVGS